MSMASPGLLACVCEGGYGEDTYYRHVKLQAQSHGWPQWRGGSKPPLDTRCEAMLFSGPAHTLPLTHSIWNISSVPKFVKQPTVRSPTHVRELPTRSWNQHRIARSRARRKPLVGDRLLRWRLGRGVRGKWAERSRAFGLGLTGYSALGSWAEGAAGLRKKYAHQRQDDDSKLTCLAER